MKYKFVNKSIYFPKQKILAIGDLHIGYEEMLRAQGIALPFNQLETTKNEIKEIIDKLKKQGYGLKKIILLGDIKHHFNFQIQEKNDIRNFIKFLEKFVTNQNIILIKGNHDKMEFGGKKYKDYCIQDGIAFTHGHKSFSEIFDKKVKTIVMSHIHPAVMLKDPNGIKREKYKCFLVGRYKRKNWIIVPSFFPLIEGSEINDYEEKKEFSIIPKNKLKNFKTFIIGKDKIYEFGELKKLD